MSKETKMMLVGSKALLHHFPQMKRKSHDTDYFTTDESKVGVDGDIEIHYVPESVIPYTDVISANNLFTLKISHAVRDINFKKHFNDIKFMIKHGCQVNKPLLKRFYALEHYFDYDGKYKDFIGFLNKLK